MGKLPGSARVSRAGRGVSPRQLRLSARFSDILFSAPARERKFATGTPSPARKMRALPLAFAREYVNDQARCCVSPK